MQNDSARDAGIFKSQIPSIDLVIFSRIKQGFSLPPFSAHSCITKVGGPAKPPVRGVVLCGYPPVLNHSRVHLSCRRELLRVMLPMRFESFDSCQSRF